MLLSGPFAQAGTAGATSVSVDPTGKYLYVANGNSSNVSGFSINPLNGELSAVAGSPFAAGLTPTSVSTDPSGKFVYVTNQGGGVSAYTINATTGSLTTISGGPFPSGASPQSVAVDPSGGFAYVANGGATSNHIAPYTINARSGVLSNVLTSAAAGSTPISVTTTGTIQ